MPKKKQLRLDLRERLANGLTRAGEFFGGERSEHVVKFDALAERFFTDTLDRWPKFHELSKRGEESLPSFGEYLTDVFMGLYLTRPEYREMMEMQASHRVNRELMDQTLHTSLWKQARSRSMLNRFHSMLGLLHVAENTLNEMPEEMKQQSQEQQQRLDQLQELIDNAANALQGDDNDVAEGAAEALESALDQLASSIDEDWARRVLRKSLKDAADEMDQLDRMVTSWGCDPGELNLMDPTEAMDLFARMRSLPNLKKFTDELGKQRDEAQMATQQLWAKEAQEIVDVTTGGKWQELLPNERLMLVDPALELAFWARMAQDGTLSWLYAGREQAGKGPFVVCLDVSGSTMGQREVWGKAFALAAIDLASRQSRDVGIIMFDWEVKPEGVWVISQGRATLKEKVEIASYFTGGGTNFEEPLRIAVENIQARLGGWEHADIVLVTDGQCHCTEEFIAWFGKARETHGIRVQGVMLDSTYTQSMEPLCDRIVSVKSFEDSGREIFNAVAGGD